MLNKSSIKDKITSHMLINFQLLSVNQLAAQIKLIETWKSVNIEEYPVVLNKHFVPTTERDTRNKPERVFLDWCKTKKAESSFHIDAAKLWNHCPNAIKMSNTLNTAKIEILKYCRNLPI